MREREYHGTESRSFLTNQQLVDILGEATGERNDIYFRTRLPKVMRIKPSELLDWENAQDFGKHNITPLKTEMPENLAHKLEGVVQIRGRYFRRADAYKDKPVTDDMQFYVLTKDFRVVSTVRTEPLELTATGLTRGDSLRHWVELTEEYDWTASVKLLGESPLLKRFYKGIVRAYEKELR